MVYLTSRFNWVSYSYLAIWPAKDTRRGLFSPAEETGGPFLLHSGLVLLL